MGSVGDKVGCLGEDTIALYVEGLLEVRRRPEVERHIDVCAPCRQLIAAAAGGSGSAHADALSAGQLLAGKYEVVRAIGSGGMGRVVAARHVGLDQLVAIKVMHGHAHLDAESVERFMREARTAARLKNEHAVRIHDVDRLPSGAPYIVMELLEGEDLHSLQARRELGVEEAVEYVLQAGEALVEAHSLGLVHRDLKPHNLFLARLPDGRARVKVVDFGLAKEVKPIDGGSSLTADRAILGSPLYMSPEQVRSSKDIDARVDIWALGATLHKLLTGRPPFESGTLQGLLGRILSDPAPSVTRVRPEVPIEIDRIVGRALEKAPGDRFPNIEAFIQALRAAMPATLRDDVPPNTLPTEKAKISLEVSDTERVVNATVRLRRDAASSDTTRSNRASIGRFRIMELIGTGGMGDVYRAHDSVLDRSVALKVLKRERDLDDSGIRRRVVREARAAAALTHVNTVTIFDVGEDDGDVFIAMELLEGETLRAHITRNDASLAVKVRWLAEAARALAAAHERGLVHRDVKPENMFICRNGTLKLLDFGIAKHGEEELPTATPPPESIGPSSLATTPGRQLGTPRYMAPEQRAGEPTDARTDQYSWGLVACELLAGRPPVGARALDPPMEVPRLHPAIAAAIARAREPVRENRFPSMAPILDALLSQHTEEEAAKEDNETSAAVAQTMAPVPTPAAARKPWLPAALVIVGAIAVVGPGAVVGARWWARRPKPTACVVHSSREIAVAADERIGVDATGALLMARDVDRNARLEREAPGGKWVARASPMPIEPKADLDLMGATLRGQSAITLVLRQATDRGAVVMFSTEETDASMRVFGPLSGVAVVSFDGGAVVVTTVPEGAQRRLRLPIAVELRRIGDNAELVLEKGAATNPSAAAAGDRMAVAWSTSAGVRFAWVDKHLVRLASVIQVTPAVGAPAVTFDGKRATVFWSETASGRVQLMTASIGIGDLAFSTPHAAIDDTLGSQAPVAVETAGSRWGIAWVRTIGAQSTLRFASVDATGNLAGIVDVARGATVERVRAGAGARPDATLLWFEGPTRAHTAAVSCAGPGTAPLK